MENSCQAWIILLSLYTFSRGNAVQSGCQTSFTETSQCIPWPSPPWDGLRHKNLSWLLRRTFAKISCRLSAKCLSSVNFPGFISRAFLKASRREGPLWRPTSLTGLPLRKAFVGRGRSNTFRGSSRKELIYLIVGRAQQNPRDSNSKQEDSGQLWKVKFLKAEEASSILHLFDICIHRKRESLSLVSVS